MADYKFILPIYGIIKPTRKVKNPALSLNWYRNAHYRANNQAKKAFKKHMQAQINKFDAIEGKISIHYKYYAKRQGTDLENFVTVVKKYFQDALSESGIIKDDNCSVIVENREKYMGVDKEDPRVECFIKVK